jgi:dolichol kinase
VGFWVDPAAVPPAVSWARIASAAILASVAGAALESLRIPRVNDNITVPLGAALAAWLLVVLC